MFLNFRWTTERWLNWRRATYLPRSCQLLITVTPTGSSIETWKPKIFCSTRKWTSSWQTSGSAIITPISAPWQRGVEVLPMLHQNSSRESNILGPRLIYGNYHRTLTGVALAITSQPYVNSHNGQLLKRYTIQNKNKFFFHLDAQV